MRRLLLLRYIFHDIRAHILLLLLYVVSAVLPDMLSTRCTHKGLLQDGRGTCTSGNELAWWTTNVDGTRQLLLLHFFTLPCDNQSDFAILNNVELPLFAPYSNIRNMLGTRQSLGDEYSDHAVRDSSAFAQRRILGTCFEVAIRPPTNNGTRYIFHFTANE